MAEKKTEAQKAEILKYAEDTTIASAARQYGVGVATINRWKAEAKAKAAVKKTGAKAKSAKAKVTKKADEVKAEVKADVAEIKDDVAAEKIEVKKNTRAAGRKVKEAAEKVEAAAQDPKEAAQIEAGKKKAKVTRKIAEKKAEVKEAREDKAAKRAASKMNLVFQSAMGGAITPEEIVAKLPKEATDAYVKIAENKIYWVGKKGEMGSVEIW